MKTTTRANPFASRYIGFSVLLLLVIVSFKYLVSDNVIKDLFVAAGYTYGPLMGLFFFGLFTKWHIKDKLVPLIAVLSPVVCYILKANSEAWFGYTIGFELLLINGALTFVGLLLIRQAND